MLENLKVAPKVTQSPLGAVAVEFDGTMGEATTAGVVGALDFEEYLRDAGYDPGLYEIVGTPRTSRWQRYDGEWLTAYKFQFRVRSENVDLPLLYKEAKKKIKPYVGKTTDKALVICWADLQIGKVDHRGGIDALLQRVENVKAQVISQVKKEKPTQVVFMDVGDLVENFSNAANLQQLRTNDLSIMQQIDLATTIIFDFLTALSKYVPEIVYASVGSNHCQWRVSKQVVGTSTDDWGVFIGRQLARLSQVAGLNIRFYEPATHDESLTIEVFGHRLGLVHGHQVNRPEGIPDFWRKSAFGSSPISAATVLVSGHFHHLRVTELGATPDGRSRFWIQAATLDNGSGWYMRTSGEDSQPGLVIFYLEKDKPFTGSVQKILG